MAPEGKTKCNSNCGLLGNVAEPDGSGLRAVSRSQSPGQSAPTGMQWQAGHSGTGSNSQDGWGLFEVADCGEHRDTVRKRRTKYPEGQRLKKTQVALKNSDI